MRAPCALTILLLSCQVSNSSGLQVLLQLSLAAALVVSCVPGEVGLPVPAMLLSAGLCSIFQGVAVMFCELMDARWELLQCERWERLAPLMHWSLLFTVRRVCIEPR